MPCISPRSNTTRKTIGCEPSRFVRDVDLHPVLALLPGVGALTLDSRVDICLYNVIVIRMSDRKSELRGRAMPSESERVTIRLPPDKVKALHQLVKGGTFTTISDAIRAAIDRFIDIQFAPDYIRRLMIELPKGNVVDLQHLVKPAASVSVKNAARKAVRGKVPGRPHKALEGTARNEMAREHGAPARPGKRWP